MLDWLDDALRLTGRLLLLAFVALAVFLVAGVALKPAFPMGLPAGPERFLVVGFVGVVACAVANIVGVFAFERGHWELAGLHRVAWRPLPMLAATVAGFLVVLVPAGALLASGHLTIVATAEGSWASSAGNALLWLAAPALAEELVLRGYAFGALERQWGARTAIALTSLAFGVMHVLNPEATLMSIAAVVVAGVFLGAVRSTTQSVIAAWLAHLAVNWAQGAVLHAPISGLEIVATPGYRTVPGDPAWLTGGPWGLEAGAATAAAFLVVSFLFLAWARPRREPTGRPVYRPSR